MKLLSTNTCRVPADLGSVTTIDYDKEVPAELGGLTSSQAAAIWSAVEALYKTGFTPAITFCLRRHGKIVFNRSIGHARGNGPEDAADTPKQLATPDTPICLFSASKVVTAMLVHKLDEDGLIDLLDPVSHYIPEYGVNGKRNATIYHLLAHRGLAGAHEAHQHHVRPWLRRLTLRHRPGPGAGPQRTCGGCG